MACAEVIVVGGGPVGLYVALALTAEGIAVRVVERRARPVTGSRSIGVHPPALELFDELGLGELLVARGVRVRRGRAFGESGPLGTIDFARCPAPFPYVLSVPQEETEHVLRCALYERSPSALEVGEVTGVTQDRSGVVLDVRCGPRTTTLRAPLVVACDGRRSSMRAALGLSFEGATYAGHYAMADFPDETSFGDDAAVYVDRRGLVESFPLPGGVRRWVARLGEGTDEVGGDGLRELVARIRRRCGQRADPSGAHRASTFRAERRLAQRLAVGRVALAGDAAHVVSPIGGQGMNLGWLGARDLVAEVAPALRRGAPLERILARDGRRRARLARAAARRAEVNMWLGRPGASTWMREALLRALLLDPLSGGLSRVFTMRGLALGV